MPRGHDLTIKTRPDGTQTIEGTGLIRNKGRTIWTMRYHDPATNRPVKRSTKTADERLAMRAWTALMADRNKGVAVGPDINTITLTEAYQAVVANYRNNDRKTLRENEYRFRLHLEPFFGGGTKMHQIRRDRIEAFTQHRLDEGAKAATVNKDLILLRRMFSLATQHERLSTAAPHIANLAEHNVRLGYFEAAAFEAVRAKLPPELRPVVTVAYITGWRIPSEVLTLEWRQVDFNAGTLTLDPHTTKNEDAREFPFTPELRRVLREQRDKVDALAATGVICRWLFFRTYATKRGGAAKDSPRRAKPIKRFDKAWAAACVAAGQPGKLGHDFRRTAIRNMVRRGVPAKVAMALTGHRTFAVFQRYNIVSPDDLREAAQKLAGLGA